MSERIAIFGGSFNPPHRGHLTSALAAAEQLRPDRFLIMPDHLPPHKVMSPASPTPQQRLELCRLGFASVPGAEVSDVEVARGGKSYTADTLRQLRTLWPDASTAAASMLFVVVLPLVPQTTMEPLVALGASSRRS